MKKLLKFILFLSVTVFVGLSLQGKMVLAIAGWRVDMPLWLAFLFLIALLGLTYIAYQMLWSILNFPFAFKKKIVDWYHARRASALSAKSEAILEWKKKLVSTDPLPSFKTLPRLVRNNPEMVSFYAQLISQKGPPPKAERFIRQQLKRRWQESVVKCYGQIKHPDLQKLLIHAEKWLRTHPQSPGLFYTLGCLCERLSLWGKSQRYFETSLALAPSPEAYASLGILLERRQQPTLASQTYKKGLMLSQSNKGPADAVD